MSLREIEAKSILRRSGKIDSWFVSHYGMNLYRGCSHNCVYCDGRAESYYVEGVFGEDVAVKVNAREVLMRELDPRRKRKPMKRSFVVLGGGVGDSYQPADVGYSLSRKALELIDLFDFPVHVLTKSTLVKRDADILRDINRHNRALVSFSLSSADDRLSALVEPGVPGPSERLNTIRFFKDRGFSCGAFMMPVIPFVTDSEERMEETIERAGQAGADFIIFGGLTLKEGRQKAYYYRFLQKHFPELLPRYQALYQGGRYGEASGDYYNAINRRFSRLAKKHRLPRRMPRQLFQDILSAEDFAIVVLEHIDYLLKLEGEKSSFGYAAYALSKIKEPLVNFRNRLSAIKGVSRPAGTIIAAILGGGVPDLYEELMAGTLAADKP